MKAMFHFGKLVGAAALICMTLSALPLGARAQEPATAVTKIEDRRVTVHFDSVRLSGALKILMDSVEANYTINDSLRSGVVTASLKDVPLRIALDKLLEASSVPATYRLEDGIYLFVPRASGEPVAQSEVSVPDVAPLPAAGQEKSSEKITAKIFLDFSNPQEVAPALGKSVLQGIFPSFGLTGNPYGNGRPGGQNGSGANGIGTGFGSGLPGGSAPGSGFGNGTGTGFGNGFGTGFGFGNGFGQGNGFGSGTGSGFPGGR